MIKILIVDDSKTETMLLRTFFEAEKDMEVIACAKDGEEAVKLNALLKPTIITMDIQMPKLNGLEATRIIMSQHPVPIVVISSALNNELMNTTFLALEAGALSVLEKPDDVNSPHFKKMHTRMIDTVRGMAEIKVIKRRFHKETSVKQNNHQKLLRIKPGHYEIIAIGSSVGGPQALKKILSDLPENFPVPIVVVQHMTPGFINGFASWLAHHTAVKVKTAENLEVLKNGTVYFAPDGYHLEIKKVRENLVALLVAGNPISGFCPSITVLLESVTTVCGERGLGVLLTGMGSDGAQGLLALKNAKGHTIIQDQKSAVVFGMAGVAQSLGAVDEVVDLDQIGQYLIKVNKVGS